MERTRSARGAAKVAAGVALFLAAGLGSAHAGQGQPQPVPGDQPMPEAPAPMVAPPATDPTLGPPPIRRGQPVSALVFDFSNAAMSPVDGNLLARQVMNTIKGGMIFSQKFDVVTYSRRLPLLRKAEMDLTLTPEDQANLYDPTTGALDPARALRVARLLRVQSVLSGTVEDVQINREGNSATVSITVQLLNSVTGEPVLPAAAVSGSATGTEENTAVELALLAARDAGYRALAEFGIGAGVEEGKAGGAVVGLPSRIGSAPAGDYDPRADADWFARHGVPPWVGLMLYTGALLSPAAFRHTPMHHLP